MAERDDRKPNWCSPRRSGRSWSGLTRRPKSAQALALRARIVLACASGQDEHGGGRRAADQPGDGGQVAPAVCG